ncbi:MAG: penicillin-binding protein activator [Rickettsiales bacterium]|nr:penicillin-binding protein activator [Rickettsiales bacterium]
MVRSLLKRPILCALLLATTSCMPPSQPTSAPTAPLAKPQPVVEQTLAPPPIGTIPMNVPPVKIALLLPLTGESMTVGKAMLDASTMALYDNYFSTPPEDIRSQVVLILKDTGNTAADSARAAKQAIDQGAQFIIGPLFSQSVTAITPLARENNLGMLTFSNNRQVAAPSIYTFGFLPEQQVARMAEYTYLRNYTRVALLAPNDSYGTKIQESLVPAFAQKGGTVAPVELYAPNPANIEAAVARLAAYNNSTQSTRFEAIFIADGGPQLKTIIAALKKTNIDLTKIKLFGTGLWDDPEIAKIPEMQGAWFSSSPSEAYRNFEKRFTTTFGYKPMRLAGLAYDAVTVAIRLTMSNPHGLSDTALTRDDGFEGLANGLVRLRPSGISDRKLAIMEVTPGGFKVIDPAPRIYEKGQEPEMPSLEPKKATKEAQPSESSAPTDPKE